MKRLSLFTIILGIFFIFSSVSNAEDYLFKVLAVKGTVKINKASSGNWTSLKTGDKLFKNDIIMLDVNSYLGLAHSNGKMLQLKSKGEYAANKLSMQILASNSNLNKKFGKYISDQISNSQGMLDKESQTDKMKTTGSVNRAVLVPSSGQQSSSILTHSPKKINLTQPEMTFTWTEMKGIPGYRFVLTDKFNREIYSKKTQDTSLRLDFRLLSKKIDEDTYYFWFVESEIDPELKSAVSCFQICSKTKTEEIMKSFNELKTELGEEETAINYLTYAAFFEDNNFLNEAKEYYLKAIALEPEVTEFQNLYNLFLQKYQ